MSYYYYFTYCAISIQHGEQVDYRRWYSNDRNSGRVYYRLDDII